MPGTREVGDHGRSQRGLPRTDVDRSGSDAHVDVALAGHTDPAFCARARGYGLGARLVIGR